MKTLYPITLALLFSIVCLETGQASAQDSFTPTAPADSGTARSSQERIEKLVREMTLEEKVKMCFGGTQPGVVQIPGVPRLGVPRMMGSDGPRGVVAARDTAFPSGLAMASSWDTDLFQRVGEVIGKEAREAGISMIFAPAVNIERDPLGGRFFEYLSEDPYLSGQLGAAMVRGIQSQRVASCVKHFTANNREENRDWYMSNIDERTLHEIYLPAFEAAVKQGGAWCVMTAANGINGQLAATNKYLITDTLKHRWGFQGLVLTDFNQARDTLAAADAGLDVGMPWGDWNSTPFGKPLMDAVEKGLVPKSTLDDKVRRILGVMSDVGLLEGIDPHAGGAANTPEARAVALRSAEESVVLLKNEGNLLPLDKGKLRHVIVLGPNANRHLCQLGMGGSSGVQAAYEVTPLDGLQKRLAGKAEVEYLDVPEEGEFETIDERVWQLIGDRRGLLAKYFNDGEPLPAVTRVDSKIDFTWEMRSPDPAKIHSDNFHAVYEGHLVPTETGYYTFRLSAEDEASLIVNGLPLIEITGRGRVRSQTATMYLEAGRIYGVNVSFHAYLGDASLHLEWSLPSGSDQAASALNAFAYRLRAADAVIFIGGWGHGLDTEGQDRQDMNFPPAQRSIIERLPYFNPRTVVVLIHGSPFTMDWLVHIPAVLDAFYPGMEGGTAIAEILLGDMNPSGKLTFTWPKRLQDAPSRRLGTQDHSNVNYKEGVFTGYRYYDTQKVEPQFPFGFGLSYSSFCYHNLKVVQRGDRFEVSLDVRNTSARPGTEIVQLYVSPPRSSVPQPLHELKAFARVFLPAGQSQTVRMIVSRTSLGYWDTSRHEIKIDPGRYRFSAGGSSRAIQVSTDVRMTR